MMNNLRRILENQKLAIRICLLLMLIGGLVLSVMVPPWQSPDEYAHLRVIGESLENDSMADYMMQDMELDQARIRFQYDEKVDVQAWKDAMTKVPDYTREDCMPKGLCKYVIKRIPSTAGVLLGVLLHLPTFWVLELGELFSLLFYIAICGLALKLMPIKKEVLLMIMSFPMTLQQAASLGYDGELLPICFLFVAYVFYMRHRKERLGWKEVACTLLLLLLIAYIKLPYVMLGLLVFILPLEKIHLRVLRFEIDGTWLKKRRIFLGILLAAAAVAGIYMLRDNLYVQLVSIMIQEWKRTLYLFGATGYKWGKYILVSSVGQFGWLEATLPFSFVIASYLLLCVMAVWGETSEIPYRLKRGTRGFLWIVCCLLGCFTLMSMVNHTITTMLWGSEQAFGTYDVREGLYQIPYIGGLQGRYFLPFLVLPFLALPEKKYHTRGKAWLVAVYMVIGIAITARVLYLRYWIG